MNSSPTQVAYNSLTEIVAAYWPILLTAFLVSATATPLCRRFALAKGIVDRPDDFLKPHKRPIPYLGGVAIFLGWTAGIALGWFRWGADVPPGPHAGGPALPSLPTIGILLAGLGITALGLFDDLRIASPKAKLLEMNRAKRPSLAVFGT